jgi:hypothetical protein
VTKLVAAVAIAAIGLFLGAWMLMLTVGVIHHEWWSFIPPMSFKASLILSFVLMVRLIVGHVLGEVAKEVTK